MKNIKRLKVFTLLCVLCYVSLIFSACAQEEETVEKRFLKKNYQKLDMDNFSKIKLIDSEIGGKEIFFAAEYHNIYPYQKLQMNFLKYLKGKTDIKYLISEMSCGDAVMINKYLETGDENILNQFFKNGKNYFTFTDDFYEFFKELYTFNKTLSNEEKIKIVGVDMELRPDNAIWALDSLVQKGDTPEKIKPIIDKLKYINSNIHKPNKENPIDYLYELSTNLLESIEKNTSIYENYLGGNYFDFKTITENLKYTCENYLGRHGSYIDNRDATMYANFQKYYAKLSKGKYFGQFGMNHVFQKSINGKEYFASFLNNDEKSPVKEKILTIVYLNKKNEDLNNTNEDFYFSDTCSSEILNVIDPYLKSDLTLFKLTGKDSPFEKSFYKYCFPSKGIGLENLSGSKGEATTDYFQYLLIIKNSKEAKFRN